MNLCRYEEALECFEKAGALDRKRAAIYHRKADAFFQLQRYDEAQEAAAKCLQIEGDQYRPIYDGMMRLITEEREREKINRSAD
jgi:tetratricopeptide (TPR) repeat protein